MRNSKPIKPTKAQRHIQRMIPDFVYLPLDGFNRLRKTFTAALPTTKAWTLSRDFQMNVDAALEREQTK